MMNVTFISLNLQCLFRTHKTIDVARICILGFLMLMQSPIAYAQTPNDQEQVATAMMDYITGFYEGDTARISKSISRTVTKYGYWKENTGPYRGEPMSYQQMIDYALDVARHTKKLTIGSREKVEVFDVQNQTASGKVTAWWGTDYILLHKINDKWMIRMVLWQSR